VEIDKGIHEAKDITKLAKEATARENERWTKEKTRLGTTKPVRGFPNNVWNEFADSFTGPRSLGHSERLIKPASTTSRRLSKPSFLV
jgi:hypothetical protein